MKYNAKRVVSGEHAGLWAVHTGSRYWPNTTDTDKYTVNLKAIEMSAIWHMKQAQKLLDTEGLSYYQAQEIAYYSVEMVRTATDITRQQDPDFDEMDANGWTC